ncbi:MAG TPA: hypothetical protein VM008_10625 [Phycisphaerae bacterium]|nr:hypothetical protein [Phycisphaerae bacterium]
MSLLERNLEALKVWTPRTAEVVAAASVPGGRAGFERCVGSDGSDTYRRVMEGEAGGERRVEWLGGTSMPRESALSIVESLAVGTGNGLGLSIGSGYEWRAFAGKLGSAQAVFVYEPEAGLVRMALEICDLAEFLRSGKIVIFTGDGAEASEELSAFLRRHVGFDPPGVLHPLPTLVGERRNLLLGAGEAIVRRVIIERQGVINSLVARLDQGLGEMNGERVAMTLTPRYAGERPMREVLRGVTELRIDHHTSTSIAARLEMIVTRRPAVIVSDLFRPQLGCVPPGVVVETWVPPGVGAAYWDRVPRGGRGGGGAGGEIGATDRVVVHSGYHEARFLERGIAKGEIELRAVRPRAGVMHGEPGISLRHRVAMIGDLPAMDAAALGIQLPTHLAVYAAAREIIEEDYLSVHVGAAVDVLRRALVRAKVSVGADGATDPSLRDPMLRVVRDVLIPNVPLLMMAEKLAGDGIALRLVGDWTGFDAGGGQATGRNVVVEAFPAWHEGESGGVNAWGDVAVLVHLSPTGSLSPLVWDAVGAEVAVLSPQHPTDSMAGALPGLLKAGVEFAQPSAGQVVATVKALLRDGERRGAMVAAAKLRLR